jgi:hypothetical protein
MTSRHELNGPFNAPVTERNAPVTEHEDSSFGRRAFLGALLGAGALGIASCTGSSDSSPAVREPGTGGKDELFAEVASFETVIGTTQRVMVGLSTTDGRVLHGGEIEFVFVPPGDDRLAAITTRATFLPVPGSTAIPASLGIGLPSEGIGVYSASVDFPTAGIWSGEANIAGDVKQRAIQFPIEVLGKSKIPNVGDPAPRTQNPIVVAADMPAVRIDSRSGPDGLGDEFADPILHQHVISELLDAKKPFVVIVSTPTFCQSKFCGPLTDLLQKRAEEKRATDNDVAFIHLEVWNDFANTVINKFAADWIFDGSQGREPWLFAVNREGIVVARYDNLLTAEDLESAIAMVA